MCVLEAFSVDTESVSCLVVVVAQNQQWAQDTFWGKHKTKMQGHFLFSNVENAYTRLRQTSLHQNFTMEWPRPHFPILFPCTPVDSVFFIHTCVFTAAMRDFRRSHQCCMAGSIDRDRCLFVCSGCCTQICVGFVFFSLVSNAVDNFGCENATRHKRRSLFDSYKKPVRARSAIHCVVRWQKQQIHFQLYLPLWLVLLHYWWALDGCERIFSCQNPIHLVTIHSNTGFLLCRKMETKTPLSQQKQPLSTWNSSSRHLKFCGNRIRFFAVDVAAEIVRSFAGLKRGDCIWFLVPSTQHQMQEMSLLSLIFSFVGHCHFYN